MAAASARNVWKVTGICNGNVLSNTNRRTSLIKLKSCLYNVSIRSNHKTTRYYDEIYNTRKSSALDGNGIGSFTLPDQNPAAIFSNNELSLKNIEIYGFDYDYTLATYSSELHNLIFSLGKQALVNKHMYPKAILDFEYDSDFAVRGLHYDVRKGLLMKIDQFHNIQLGTVYRGLNPVPDHEVISIYNGTHIAVENMNSMYGSTLFNGPMHQMVDLFALPEVTLISLVTDYFIKKNIAYDPEYVFYDIRNAVQEIHSSGLLHQAIQNGLDQYLSTKRSKATTIFLSELVRKGKKIFLITNSDFVFVDKGMSHIVGPDWQDLFDIVIVSARKPKFFKEGYRPFRVYNTKEQAPEWDRVTKLQKGVVYHQGNHHELQKMTGWGGPKVLYFGDHLYSDLIDPSLKYGWRTAAIIPELEREINIMNSAKYKFNLKWLVALQQLIEETQYDQTPHGKEFVLKWIEERDDIRKDMKESFNTNFGSLFRTYHNPTYLFRRLARFADIYMSNLTNLLYYPTDHTFYPHRILLPHEPSIFSCRHNPEKGKNILDSKKKNL